MGRMGTLRSRAGQDLSGRNHAFFVGKSHGLPSQDRRVRGFKSRYSYNCRDHKICLWMSGAGDGSFAAMDDMRFLDSSLAQTLA